MRPRIWEGRRKKGADFRVKVVKWRGGERKVEIGEGIGSGDGK